MISDARLRTKASCYRTFINELENIAAERENDYLDRQCEIVSQRLQYHFAKVEGDWDIRGMNSPFMKEFLYEVNKLVEIATDKNA